MKKIITLSVSIVLALTLFGISGCKSKSAEGTPTAGKIAVGHSCSGIGSMEARMHCDEDKVMFCSSYTKYKYTIQQTCPKGQVCDLAKDGKSATCVDKAKPAGK